MHLWIFPTLTSGSILKLFTYPPHYSFNLIWADRCKGRMRGIKITYYNQGFVVLIGLCFKPKMINDFQNERSNLPSVSINNSYIFFRSQYPTRLHYYKEETGRIFLVRPVGALEEENLAMFIAFKLNEHHSEFHRIKLLKIMCVWRRSPRNSLKFSIEKENSLYKIFKKIKIFFFLLNIFGSNYNPLDKRT